METFHLSSEKCWHYDEYLALTETRRSDNSFLKRSCLPHITESSDDSQNVKCVIIHETQQKKNPKCVTKTHAWKVCFHFENAWFQAWWVKVLPFMAIPTWPPNYSCCTNIATKLLMLYQHGHQTTHAVPTWPLSWLDNSKTYQFFI